MTPKEHKLLIKKIDIIIICYGTKEQQDSENIRDISTSNKAIRF